MDDFEEKLNSILSSPETMGQIMALADSLTGKSGGEAAGEQAPAQDVPPSGGSPLNLFADLDPQLMSRAAAILGEYTAGNDEKTALLTALRPFLSEERRPRLDKAVRIAQLARVIRRAMGEFGRDLSV